MISKRVEAMLTRTVVTLKSESITTSYSDRLAIEMFGDDTTFAYRILRSLAGESGVVVVMRQIVNGIITTPCFERSSPENHYDGMCTSLVAMLSPTRLTTAHLLYAICCDSTTVTSQTLYGYGIAKEDILREMERMVGEGCGDDVGDDIPLESNERVTPKIIGDASIGGSAIVTERVRSLLDALGRERGVVIIMDGNVA